MAKCKPHYKKAGQGKKRKKIRFKSAEEKARYAERIQWSLYPRLARARGETPTLRRYAEDQRSFERK